MKALDPQYILHFYRCNDDVSGTSFSNWINNSIVIVSILFIIFLYVCGSDFKEAFVEGKLKAFLNDLYSGKLHREFHYGPDPETTSEAAQVSLSFHPFVLQNIE